MMRKYSAFNLFFRFRNVMHYWFMYAYILKIWFHFSISPVNWIMSVTWKINNKIWIYIRIYIENIFEIHSFESKLFILESINAKIKTLYNAGLSNRLKYIGYPYHLKSENHTNKRLCKRFINILQNNEPPSNYCSHSSKQLQYANSFEKEANNKSRTDMSIRNRSIV